MAVSTNTHPEIKTSGFTPDDVLQMLGTNFDQSAAALFHNYMMQLQREVHLKGSYITIEEARIVAQENVGYEMNRYAYAIAQKAEVLLGAYHPIFGKTEESKDMPGSIALTAGYLLDRLQKAGFKYQETLLYYPNRKTKGVTLKQVLKNPEHDPILGPLSIQTAEEQRIYEEKEDAFFKNLKV